MNGEPGTLFGIAFPYTDLTASKRRPVVVVVAPDERGDFLGLAVTSVPTEASAIAINSDDLADGELPKASWIRYDKLFTLNTQSVVKTYGRLRAETLGAVRQGVCRHLGCQ